jgi:hypothetical protein
MMIRKLVIITGVAIAIIACWMYRFQILDFKFQIPFRDVEGRAFIQGFRGDMSVDFTAGTQRKFKKVKKNENRDAQKKCPRF